MIYSQRDVYIVLMLLVYDFYIGLFDADTGISQAVDADSHHGLVALHTAKLTLEVLQRAADNADLIACLEDVVVHLDSALGMTEHELESFYLGFGNEGWGILTGKSEELVDKGMVMRRRRVGALERIKTIMGMTITSTFFLRSLH
jgi:hypothetical protein